MAVDWASLGMGVLGAGGSFLQGAQNKRIAREQMEFQERMSSTSAQRSVADYKAAGLNPALAYERGASSPGGASAVIGDAIGAGVSSALQVKQARQAMELARESANQQNALTRAQRDRTQIESANLLLDQERKKLDTLEARRQFQLNLDTQGAIKRSLIADAIMKELGIPEATNRAKWAEKLGIYQPIITDALSGARSIAPLLRR